MVTILYKWFFIASVCFLSTGYMAHPIYVSVTEIEHNSKERMVEVSCKLFTDDFEKALRTIYKKPVDLIHPKDRPAMDRLVEDYVKTHLKIAADGRELTLKYLGYELIEEAIYSYYEVPGIEKMASVSVVNNLLYDFQPEQMGLMHITVGGNRKSTKLNYPDVKAAVHF
jgi:hypothetical protein